MKQRTSANTKELARPSARLKELGIKLPTPPNPFGTYAETVQTETLLFLSGMLPTEGHEAKVIGRVGVELDLDSGRQAANSATHRILGRSPTSPATLLPGR